MTGNVKRSGRCADAVQAVMQVLVQVLIQALIQVLIQVLAASRGVLKRAGFAFAYRYVRRAAIWGEERSTRRRGLAPGPTGAGDEQPKFLWRRCRGRRTMPLFDKTAG